MNSMFYTSLTVIDAAVVWHGHLRGISLNPVFTISGPLNGKEQVVADFSSFKKHLKSVIDHKETGFDHKIWISRNDPLTSVYQIVDVLPTGELMCFNRLRWDSEEEVKELNLNLEKVQAPEVFSIDFALPDIYADGYSLIRTPGFSAIVPTQDVVIFDNITLDELDQVTYLANFEEILTNKLRKAYPGLYDSLSIKVSRLHRNEMPLSVDSDSCYYKTFSYTHGLAHSTSWGCNLITHGHSSYVVVKVSPKKNPDGRFNVRSKTWARTMACLISDYLNASYIYSKEHLINESEHLVNLGYITDHRGLMLLTLDKRHLNLIELDVEPTIENIVSHVTEKFKSHLHDYRIESVYISEGSNKGAVANFIN